MQLEAKAPIYSVHDHLLPEDTVAVDATIKPLMDK